MPLGSLFLIISLTVVATFCAEVSAQLPPRDILRAHVLGDRIAALGPKVRRDEAGRVAECAYATAQRLRRNYGTVWGPPSLNNILVNTGIRKRGLCFQWAEDLLAQLDALKVTTLDLHWAEAYAGTWREHNVVVVTAKDRPMHDGILLDCWRHSGHLFWSAVAADDYPWVEDSKYAGIARGKFAAKKNPALSKNNRTRQMIRGATITASTY
jgi:hypothetical protein